MIMSTNKHGKNYTNNQSSNNSTKIEKDNNSKNNDGFLLAGVLMKSLAHSRTLSGRQAVGISHLADDLSRLGCC